MNELIIMSLLFILLSLLLYATVYESVSSFLVNYAVKTQAEIQEEFIEYYPDNGDITLNSDGAACMTPNSTSNYGILPAFKFVLPSSGKDDAIRIRAQMVLSGTSLYQFYIGFTPSVSSSNFAGLYFYDGNVYMRIHDDGDVEGTRDISLGIADICSLELELIIQMGASQLYKQTLIVRKNDVIIGVLTVRTTFTTNWQTSSGVRLMFYAIGNASTRLYLYSVGGSME